MHEYDVTLKLILRERDSRVAQALTGVRIERWLNVELPEVQQTRVDLLGETAESQLVHVELQSSNDGHMPVRMLEYSARVYRRFGRFPRQILLYVGAAPMRMASELAGERLRFGYDAVDIRELDGERLMDSSHLSDNVIAILARLRDGQGAIRTILSRIAASQPEQREIALKQLLILSGLRNLAQYVREEAKGMPVLNDIMDHEVIGPAIRKGIERGRDEEARAMLRRLIVKRFGAFPEWAAEIVANRSSLQLEELGERLFDVETVEQLFQRVRAAE